MNADLEQVLRVMQALSFHCVQTAPVLVAKLNESMKREMDPLKARAHQIYINVKQMENVSNVYMTHNAPDLAINALIMFVSVGIHQGHVIQPSAMNAKKVDACVVIIHHALKNSKT